MCIMDPGPKKKGMALSTLANTARHNSRKNRVKKELAVLLLPSSNIEPRQDQNY